MKNKTSFSLLISLLFLSSSGLFLFEDIITHATEGIGQCREPLCDEEQQVEPKPCPQGQMTWPKTGNCVVSDCQKEGFTLSRDAFGNCVPKQSACEDAGYIRDSSGICRPSIQTSQNEDNSAKDPLTKFFNDINFAKEIWDSHYPGKGYGPTSVTFSSDGTVTECINKYGNIECGTYKGSNYELPTPSITTECIYNENNKRWDCK